MADFAKRLDHMEVWREGVDEWRNSIDTIVEEMQEINKSLRDIAAAVRVFTKIGNGLKWLAGVGAATAVMIAAAKEFMP